MYGPIKSSIDHNVYDQLILDRQSIDRQPLLRIFLKNYHHLNVIPRKKQTHVELIQYLHVAYFSPTLSAFIKATVNNHFSTWPGLTSSPVQENLPISITISQDHMTSEHQGLQSATKPPST